MVMAVLNIILYLIGAAVLAFIICITMYDFVYTADIVCGNNAHEQTTKS